MKIHEYQAKALFRKYGIPVPEGRPISTGREIGDYFREKGGCPLVLKAQIHGGGRGKAGGVRMVRSPEEAESFAAGILGKQLVTAQTGAPGRVVSIVLAEEAIEAESELYLAVAIDRARGCVTVIASARGGVEIEKIAVGSPESVIAEIVDPGVGLRPFQISRIFFGLGLAPSLKGSFAGVVNSLYRLFMEKDCSLAEINPLVVTGGGLVALDGKIDFDDNGLFRHPEIAGLRDSTQEDPLEVEASRYHLSYIKLRGSVGCMVNGAGLAMATMDLIHYAGAEAANFLDVGGGATPEMVREGLRIILSDRDVKVIFINIFGGILRCDMLAAGVADAARDLSIRVPVVVRLEGTNVEEGRRILSASGLSFHVASNLRGGAEKLRALLA